MQTALVSIVIPTYNSAAFVAEAVASAFAQTHPNVEVIVVDDGSTDDTRAVLERFSDDTRFRYYYQANSGESAARNWGWKQAKGEYIVFLDGDDLLGARMAEKGVAALQQHPDCKVAYGWKPAFEGDPKSARLIKAEPTASGDLLPQIVQGITLTPGQFMVHRTCLEESGGFDEVMPWAEDWEFLLKLARRHRFVYVPEVFVLKRTHPGMESLARDRPDIVSLRRGVLRKVFGDETAEIERRYLTRPVIADWYATYGLSFVRAGRMRKAWRYVFKSLIAWPLQPDLFKWMIKQAVPVWLLRSKTSGSGRQVVSH